MSREVRVRFAPSPTGPLHIGGVRTALYNYLIAKKYGGKFLLRVEDTDQTRYVEGAEEYIVESLNWLGLDPVESPAKGGDYGPYRQSDRKSIYKEYVDQLIANGAAYYAFDTAEDLETMRERLTAEGVHSPKYDQSVRDTMVNSLTVTEVETQSKLNSGSPYVVRLKVPSHETVTFSDEVRGEVTFRTNELDDKVLLKGDGMPTYHLANVVDDYLMKISHVIRGEEWLSSTGHHVLLYQGFGWEANIPKFAHLPLILKPTGKGKLSKRDGAKFGFPVFPLDWDDKKENEIFSGFREVGFLPEAVINFLAFLGWNPGTDEELFTLAELEDAFDPKKIIKAGAKFNYDKAKWYNQQYIIKKDNKELAALIKADIEENVGSTVDMDYLSGFCGLMKERVMTLNEFWADGKFFFSDEYEYDDKTIRKKYKSENEDHFATIVSRLEALTEWKTDRIQDIVKSYIGEQGLSFGAILPIVRVCLSGTMKGPDVFAMMELFGKEKTISRFNNGLTYCKNYKA